MLNRKVLFLLTIFLTVLGPAFIIKSAISYVPFVFMVLLLAVSYGYILIIIKSFKMDIGNNSLKEFERLSEDYYSIAIENRSVLVMPRVSFSVKVTSSDGYGVQNYEYDFIIKSKEKIDIMLKIKFPHVGKFEIKVSKIKFYGFIDLLFLYKSVLWRKEFTVKPKLYTIDNYEINTVNPLFSVDYNVAQKIKGGEFNDVREYIPGDSIKNIHWKLSAHSGSLMTKIINTDAVNGISIYMDLPYFKEENYPYSADVYDCIFESAYAASLYALDKGYALNLVFFEGGNPSYIYIKDYDDLAEFVYSFPKGQEKLPLEFLIDKYSNTNVSFDNMIILTARISFELADLLADSKMQGKYPRLFLAEPESSTGFTDDSAMSRLKKSGINYSLIRDAKEFTRALGGAK